MEGFAEKDFVICGRIMATYVENFTGRSDQADSEIRIGTMFSCSARIYRQGGSAGRLFSLSHRSQ